MADLSITDEKRWQLLEALRQIDKALTVVADLCEGRQRWTMQVPARPDHDPDLVIAGALQTARALLQSLQPGAPAGQMEPISAMADLQAAIAFRDQVRRSLSDEQATATGALRDALAWLEDAARKVAAQGATASAPSQPAPAHTCDWKPDLAGPGSTCTICKKRIPF